MSRETDLLKTDPQGILIVALPKASELIVQALSRKTGRNAAEIIGVALEQLANKILDEKDTQELKGQLERLRDM